MAVIAGSVALAYGGTSTVPFLYDDLSSIVNNGSIRQLATALLPPLGATVSGRPVLNASFAINYAWGGVDPSGYHELNLAIHGAAALALFGVARRTLLTLGSSSPSIPAFLIAILWALHPLQTEAVTYVVQRAESLMALFYLLTLYAYIRSAQSLPKKGLH
jgi:hypothetical protein